MIIYTLCKSCEKRIKIKTSAITRPDLQMSKGDEFELRCNFCGHVEEVHVNDTKAGSNKTVLLIGAGLGIITTIILWYYYGAIGTASFAIPIIFWQQQRKSVSGYNSFMIKRKLKN